MKPNETIEYLLEKIRVLEVALELQDKWIQYLEAKDKKRCSS